MKAFRPFLIAAVTAGVIAAVTKPAVAADNPLAPDPMLFARGAKGWADNCGRCHNLRSAKEYSDRDWSLIVKHMRVRANIPGETARAIEAFLQASN